MGRETGSCLLAVVLGGYDLDVVVSLRAGNFRRDCLHTGDATFDPVPDHLGTPDLTLNVVDQSVVDERCGGSGRPDTHLHTG